MRDPSKMIKGMQQNRSAVAVFGNVGLKLSLTLIWVLGSTPRSTNDCVRVTLLFACVYLNLMRLGLLQAPCYTENVNQEVLI